MDRERWLLLQPLIDHALDLPDTERARWLRDLDARSPALALAVTSLLSVESLADERGFLVEPITVSLEGLELGAYTLERPLGEGGMGSVWLARRTDGRFEGRAAVKLLNLARLSPSGQARFRREGSVLARLSHPGIARLLDAGVSATGQPYLVLEHVAGEPIDDYVKTHGLSLEVRIRLFLDVLAAVGHAHANLIVHRDLKPSNILVTQDGTVKLLDFGIAKLLDTGATDEQAALTADGGRAFTPAYAAPEQVQGTTITTATDVYALGVLLYLLVSGRHPTAEGCSTPLDELRALLEVEPARLGIGDLDHIVAKALRKDPAERYQTVGAMADDLRRYLRREPVSARRGSVAYRARKFAQRYWVPVAAAMVVAVLLVGATGFSLAEMQQARGERDAAVYATRRADAQAEFQSLLVSQVGDRPITMREILDRARTAVAHEYTGQPRLLAMSLIQLSLHYAELGDSRIRGELLARAESLAVAAHDDEQRIEARCEMGDNLRTEGRYDDAHRVLAAAESALTRVRSPRVEAVCLQHEADLDGEAGPTDRSLPAIRRAIAIRDSLGMTTDMFYAGLLQSLGGALARVGQRRAAVAADRRVVALLDSTGRGETISRAIVQHDLATILGELGQTAEADSLLHDVIDRVRRTDPNGQIPQQALIHYAHIAMFQGERDSAATYFDLLATEGAHDHSAYWEGRGLFGLARAAIQQGRLTVAKRAANRLAEIEHQSMILSTDDEITDSRILMARLAMAAGDTVAADTLVRGVLRARGYFDGKRRRVFHSALLLASRTALATGRVADALGFARDARAVVEADSLSDVDDAYVGAARLAEAHALLAGGDTTPARAALERAIVALRNGGGERHPRLTEATQLLRALN